MSMMTVSRVPARALGRALCVLSLLGAVAATAPSASAADERKLDLMISPAGTGPYLAFATIQTYAPDNHEWLRPQAVETPGFVYNVKYALANPDTWTTTMFGSGEVVEWTAKEGVDPFFPKPFPEVSDFMVIGTMSQTSNLFITTDLSINTPHDFAGHHLATGQYSQNEWGMHQRLILDGLDVTKTLKSYSPIGAAPNVEAMIDGRADIGTIVLHSSLDFGKNLEPGPFKTLEASGRQWKYVSIPEADIAAYVKKTGAPFMIRKIPDGVMSNQSGEVTTIGNNMTLIAHKSFPEDLAYEFTKLWVAMGPIVAKYNAVGGIWDAKSISNLARKDPSRIHPGALRAYKELGLLD